MELELEAISKLRPRILSDCIFEKWMSDEPFATGTSRHVYNALNCDDVVIKKMILALPYQNIVEWLVWNAVTAMASDTDEFERNPEQREMFAECFCISESGRYLMMEKLVPIEAAQVFKIQNFPFWLNDKKPSSFGSSSNGNIKAIDYACVDFYRVLNPKNVRCDPLDL